MIKKIFISFASLLSLNTIGCSSLIGRDSSMRSKNAESDDLHDLAIPLSETLLIKRNFASVSEIENSALEMDERSAQWWKDYRVAMLLRNKDKAKSCELFSDLSKDKEFPLKELASLRSIQHCSDETLALPTTYPFYLKTLYYDLKLKKAMKLESAEKKPSDLLATYQTLFEIESNPQKKEDLLTSAINLSKKYNLKEEKSKFEALLMENSPRLSFDKTSDLKNKTSKILLSIAHDFRSHREYNKAANIYRQILSEKITPPPTTEELHQAYSGLRRTYKVSQEKSLYLKATAEAYQFAEKKFLNMNKPDKKTANQLLEMTSAYARTLWTQHTSTGTKGKDIECENIRKPALDHHSGIQTKETQNFRCKALKLVLTNIDVLSPILSVDELYYIAIMISDEMSDSQLYQELINKSLLSKERTASNYREKILWAKSWGLYKKNQFIEASQSFNEMSNIVRDSVDKWRALYWSAKSLQKLNQSKEANEIFEKIVNEDILSYYGIISQRELQKPFPPLTYDKSQKSDKSLLDLTPSTQNLGVIAHWLIAVGEKSYAESVLSKIKETLIDEKITDQKTWVRFYAGYAKADLYLPLFDAINKSTKDIKEEVIRTQPHLMFPTPYPELVVNSANKFEIQKEWIYSIMRQESAFNPEARSGADALGLMQLIPSVAKEISEESGLRYQRPSDLFEPENSISLGAATLRKLFKKQKEQFILATASYNAGTEPVNGWIRNRFRNDPIEFIEEIPYDETRTYVKLVIRNFIFYLRLGLVGTEKKPLVFPEELLKLNAPTSIEGR